MAKSLHSFSPATQDSLKHGLQSVREAIKALEQAVGNDTTAPRPQGLRAADEATHALRVLGDDLAHKLGIDLWTADLSTAGQRDNNGNNKTSPDRDNNGNNKTSPDRGE